MARLQWILDNWPTTVKPLAFHFSVANYNGRVMLVGDEVPHKVRRFYGHDAAGKLGWFVLPDDPSFQMSVINNSGVVTLVNDEKDPDYAQFYGVDTQGEKGWQYPIEHPFHFQQTGPQGGILTEGLVRINGVDTAITNWPTDGELADVATSTAYWITVDTFNETATWASGPQADGFPTGSQTLMVYPVLILTCGVESEVIETWEQRRYSDIVVGASSDSMFDFAFRFSQSEDDTGGTFTEGKVYINDEVFAIASAPALWTVSNVTTSIKYWVEVDLSSGSNIPTVTWKSGAAFPATASKVIIIYPILEVTCAGNVITSYIQRRCADIVLHRTWGKNSVEMSAGELQLVGDEAGPTDGKFYGKIGGNKGWYDGTDPAPTDPSPVDVLSRDGNNPPTGPGTSTAKSDSWTAGATNGLHRWVNVGTVWDGYAATPILYNMMAKMVITNKGKVYFASGETRITIDTPVNHADL